MRILFLLLLSQNVFSASFSVDSTAKAFHAEGSFTGGNFDLGSAAQASFVEMTNGSLTFTPTSGSGAISTMCATTNAATAPSTSASTCVAGNESNGISFTVSRTGLFRVCVDFSVYAQSAAATALNISDTFQLIETPTNAQTQTTNTKAMTWAAKNGAIAGADTIMSDEVMICRNFNFTSTGVKGVRLMYQMAAATVAASSHLILSDNTNNRTVHWTVDELGQ
jgi:hypothetical protein